MRHHGHCSGGIALVTIIDRVVARLLHVRRDISVREFFRKRICVYTVTQIIGVTRLSREQVEKEIEERARADTHTTGKDSARIHNL